MNRPGYKTVYRRVYNNPPLAVQVAHLKTIEEVEKAVAYFETQNNLASSTVKKIRRAGQKRIAELKLQNVYLPDKS